MDDLVKEYKIPFLGKVQFIVATGYEKSFNGTYYAKSESLGSFCKHCDSIKELKEKATREIKNYLDIHKRNSERTIKYEKERINKLENCLLELKFENWIEKYQTNNESQLGKK